LLFVTAHSEWHSNDFKTIGTISIAITHTSELITVNKTPALEMEEELVGVPMVPSLAFVDCISLLVAKLIASVVSSPASR